jgi:hypothetical protein
MDLTRRQMYAIAIIAMALAMIAVGLGFGARAAIKKAVKPKPTEVKYRGIVKPKPAGMYAVGPASSNGMVAIRDPRLDKLYASKLPAIKPVSVPSLGPAPKPATAFKIQDTRGGGVPATAPKPMRGDGPPPRFSTGLYRGLPTYRPRPVPTAPASPAPGVVSVQVPKKSSLLDAGKPAAPADPRLKALPTPVQAELARLAVRGTATQIRNAAVDLGGSTVGVLGGEFAGAPVGPDDVSAINQYLDQLSRQPASLLAGN